MKFATGQKVMVIPLQAQGVIIRGFVVKVYAQPDVNHYNVQVAGSIHECSEEEIA